MKKLSTGILCLSLAVCLAGCNSESPETSSDTSVTETTVAVETTVETEVTETTAETTEEVTENTTFVREVDMTDLLKGCDTFELNSNELVDGVWADVISNTSKGEDKSPSLSWEPVEGASEYIIYMVDLDATFWMHWKADAVVDTDLPLGWAEKGYVGPYPPQGTEHTYDIYVVALKNPLERLMGTNDMYNENFPKFIFAVDTDAEGNSGNIISYGHLSGTFIDE